MTKQTQAVFAADPEGFREQNAGRPPAHLVREAIQNAFDEATTRVAVDVRHEPGRGVFYRIADDVPGGIRDERLVFTIWMSDKADSHTKRGRMGRGLKELISVSDEVLIRSAGCSALRFERTRGRWHRENCRLPRLESGTIVEGRVKAWGASAAKGIVEYLRRMRPPEGMAFDVDDVPVYRRSADESYEVKLTTVLFETLEDGSRVPREPKRECRVDLFREQDGGEPWVYEMGVPIEPVDFPLSIDVGQRVPLREKRDTLTDPYRKELYAKLLDLRVRGGFVGKKAFKDDHVLVACQAQEHLSDETRKLIVDAYTDGRPYAVNSEVAREASGQHVRAMPLRELPECVREMVRDVGTDVRDVLAERVAASCVLVGGDAMTPPQTRLVRVWEWIAERIKRPCEVRLSSGRPSAQASFDRHARVLKVYFEMAPSEIFVDPLGAKALGILIHELAHWSSRENEHGFDFHSDAEDVGGAVAALLFRQRDEAMQIRDAGYIV